VACASDVDVDRQTYANAAMLVCVAGITACIRVYVRYLMLFLCTV